MGDPLSNFRKLGWSSPFETLLIVALRMRTVFIPHDEEAAIPPSRSMA
jgi:hypothetical protein